MEAKRTITSKFSLRVNTTNSYEELKQDIIDETYPINGTNDEYVLVYLNITDQQPNSASGTTIYSLVS